MRVRGEPTRTLWTSLEPSGRTVVSVLDQTRLPHDVRVLRLESMEDAAHAIATMQVRGAPLIGVTAAYGVALAAQDDPSDASLERAFAPLSATRPTAVNLAWALGEARAALGAVAPSERAARLFARAGELAEEDVAGCRAIAQHGAPLLLAAKKAERPLQILTHCNAGWLATIDWGTALAPIYELHARGVPLHVWVDETRPRNQGYLTAWELAEEGVPCTLIVDNAGGLLMQRGEVDVCIVGSDRTARNGDVCNKVGTYLKALAARDAGLPFYVALPWSTVDLDTPDGASIPIEERSASEVANLPFAPVRNPAFDVTPARLVTKLVTDRGVFEPSELAPRAGSSSLG